MKNLILITLIFSALQSHSQINELKSASDRAREMIKPSLKSEKDALSSNKLKFVNTFIGTGGHGHTYPGASAPFGMMQLSPDTRYDGWDGCSGYHYSDSILYGFSHTHLSGTGVSDYGDLLIVPQSGKAKSLPGYLSEDGYSAYFSHEMEKAEPGYYSVELNRGEMNVRLTTTQRAGFHEYTFNNMNDEKSILIDLDHRDKVLSSKLDIIDKQTVSGARISHSWATKQHFYFHLELDQPFIKAEVIEKEGQNKLLLIFPKEMRRVNIKVGMSHVNEKGARLNLHKEIPDWNFEATKRRVQNMWRKELNKIKFYTDNEEVMTNFYTGLYHSFLNPNVSNDVDGSYRYGENIYRLSDSDYENYTVFSLWDTYRATHPLFTITQIERTNAFINTFLRFDDYHGDLPVWELAGNETECMIGYHSVSVIADAYAKGIDDYETKKALEAMIKTSTLDEYGKREYAKEGFLSTGVEPESVSKTLEYAYDDFCIYQMLKIYSDRSGDETYNDLLPVYKNRAMHFVNLFDPNVKFMRGRRSGQWHSPFNPAEVNFNYTEANSWQYSLYAPHAVGVLTDLIGGKDSLELWLDRLFTTEMNLTGRHQVDITGLIGQYAHGNEPSHHMAYLYNYTNAPEKTQYYIDKIQKEMYQNSPDGLSGNEDCGQMSSWYVLSALGLYQIAPSIPSYEFGRPLANRAQIELENGKMLKIVSNATEENKFIQQVLFNGKELKRHYITHEELLSGGTLQFVMGKQSNPSRANYTAVQTIKSFPETFVPAPFIKQEERIFNTTMSVDLNVINKENYKIKYTTDGTSPINSSSALKFNTTFNIDEPTTIKACATDGKHYSAVVSNQFMKKNKNVSIDLISKYDNQYAASGELTLIDKIRGGNEYRTGDWQGYWDQDLEFIVRFNEPTVIKEMGLGILSDMKSWIFFPKDVRIDITYEDNTLYSDTKVLATEIEKDQYPHNTNVSFKTETKKKVKQIRVKASRVSKCPEWHLGAGNPTWLFVDEFFFK